LFILILKFSENPRHRFNPRSILKALSYWVSKFCLFWFENPRKSAFNFKRF